MSPCALCGWMRVAVAWLALSLLAAPFALARHGKVHSKSGSHSRSRSEKKKPLRSESPVEPGGAADAGTEAGVAEGSLKPRVVAMLAEAKSALEARDLDGAQKKAEAAYKKQPSGEMLFVLGKIAQAQGQPVTAQDLFRRYLADPLVAVVPAQRAEAQRVVSQHLPQLGDLHLAGDKDSLVYVDDRLLGSLPLALPLRVSAGVHHVSLVTGGRSTRGKVEVPSGQGREMRFDALTGAVLVSVPPMVVLVQEPGANLGKEVELLAALERGSQLVGYEVAGREGPLEACEALEPNCLFEATRRSGAGYALVVRVLTIAGGKDFQLALWDAQVGELAVQDSVRCLPCSDEKQLASVAEQVASVFRRGRARPRGTLSVTSIPTAAQLAVSGRAVGTTPWKGSVFAGQQQVELSARGFERQQQLMSVAPGQQASLSALLVPALGPEPLPQGVSAPLLASKRRPLWRVVTGAAAMGTGLLLIGIGGTGLAADGRCVPPLMPPAQVCRETIHSATVGGSLLGVGLGLTIGGGVLIAVPPRADQ